MTEIPLAATILITFGGLFLVGLVADLLGRHTPLPRVTLLLLAGFVLGPAAFDLLPGFTTEWFPVLTDIALAMIGFLLGQRLTLAALKKMGPSVLALSIGEVTLTALLVLSVLSLFSVPFEIALLLAGIAPATAPAATMDVVNECRAQGEFTDTLLGVVAVDDAWGLLVFSIFLAIAQTMTRHGGADGVLLSGVWEVGGAILLGTFLGVPMAYLTGRIRAGEPTQAEALGGVLLCAGLSVLAQVSYILAAMVLGATVANLAKHHDSPFHAIEGFEWPFLILFFLLAGASLHIEALAQVGVLGGAYILLRIAGRLLGTRLGGWITGADPRTRRLIGLALLPQAGVAIGMALLASQQFPDLKDTLIPVVLGSTVVFELLGPVVTRRVLIYVGEVPNE
ncbi:cation:proton antiporter [Congregibacter variabilis]|uniref:Cation:proton antiporter n=1 Tax=Congregibacter variabilis TaxID=3081200 RepID=A0ABZ0I2W9_9GAMM|nr:cation:proton antiporter [Congregibacter sp. IMCC43200]